MIALFRAIVLGEFRKDGLRAAITLIAVAIGTAVSLAIDLANASAIASFSSGADIVSNRVTLQILGIDKGFDERVLPRIAALPDVQDAAPVVQGSVVIGASRQDPSSGDILRLQGIDALHPAPGQALSSTHADPYALMAQRGVLLPAGTARRYSLRQGDRFDVLVGARIVRLLVVGVLPARQALIDSGVVFADIVSAQELFGKIGLLDRIDCIVDPSRASETKKAIEALLPLGARVVEPRVRVGEIRRMLRSFQSNLAMLSYFALLIGMYLIYNAVAVSVVARTRDIGTLRLLGVSRRQIFTLFLGEGALYGVCGSLAGLALGAFLARFSLAAVARTVADLYVGTQANAVVYTPFALLKAVLSGTALAIGAAIAPALEAACAPPAIAMRGPRADDVVGAPALRISLLGGTMILLAALAALFPAIDGVPAFGYASALLGVVGGSLLMPWLVDLLGKALRAAAARVSPAFYLGVCHLAASRRRNAVAAASLAVAVSMTVSVVVLVGSFRASVVSWANEALRADLFIRSAGVKDASSESLFPSRLLEKIRTIPGVAAADGFRTVSVPFRGAFLDIGASDFRVLAQRNKLRFLGAVDLKKLSRDLPSSNGVLASEPFVVRYGARVGDEVSVQTPSGLTALRVAGVYNDYSSDSGFLIMDARTFKRIFQDDSLDSIAIYAKSGVSVAALRTRVIRALEPWRLDVQTTRELRELVIAIFNATFSVVDALYVISIIIAVLGVTSTLFAVVLERKRDIALLRRLGLSIGGVRSMILSEAALIGLLGGAGGTVMGIALGLLLIFVVDRQSFGWLIELHMPLGFCAIAIAATIAISVAAGLYPAQAAARIRAAEILRTE